MTIQEIKRQFDKEYRLDIYKTDQTRRGAYARKVFTYYCKNIGFTYQVIGDAIGVKHDNAIYYNKTIHTVNDIDKRIYNTIAKENKVNIPLFDVIDLKVEVKKFNGIFEEFNDLLELGDEHTKQFIKTRLRPYLIMNKKQIA